MPLYIDSTDFWANPTPEVLDYLNDLHKDVPKNGKAHLIRVRPNAWRILLLTKGGTWDLSKGLAYFLNLPEGLFPANTVEEVAEVTVASVRGDLHKMASCLDRACQILYGR